jgi:RNA polymerase sigma-70 factor, ECF subfamily
MSSNSILTQQPPQHPDNQRRQVQEALLDFEAIYSAYYLRIYNYILHLIGGGQTQEAEDLTQETFTKAFKSFHNLYEHSSVSGWLHRIATNTTYDVLRRRRLIKWHSIDLSPEEGEGEYWISQLPGEAQEDPQARYNGPREAIQAALAQLPMHYRLPLLLSEAGYSYPEIAQALHISNSALKMRMMRARNRGAQFYNEAEQREKEAAQA